MRIRKTPGLLLERAARRRLPALVFPLRLGHRCARVMDGEAFVVYNRSKVVGGGVIHRCSAPCGWGHDR
jgi:hypothetical protein